ncbi:MAG: Gfo/Idh/MocA family oxidoreductase [Clostridiales bacterium]|nr:Gfo/Idh/MocA family oxidoreductase [Clostridiales bacterium]
MRKVRVGVLGARRGGSMIDYCKKADNAEVVAICDKEQYLLDIQKKNADGLDIAYYICFEDFIKHDMDAVVLANYANEHAPFAIKCLNAGKHVFSEVLPVQTMKEAVELIEAVEKSGLVYSYGENYCYMGANREMKRLYEEGKIGEFEYGEGEYIHNCEPIWPEITYGQKDHWRNNMYSTFYCTHSLGPIIHTTGLRPVSVVAFESTMNERNLRIGSKAGLFGVEIVTLENGGIVKSIHGGLYFNSIWYAIYGSKGHMESAREISRNGHMNKIFVQADNYSGEYSKPPVEEYDPNTKSSLDTSKFGHSGSDFYPMYYFIEKIKGDEKADTIDVYQALDMFLPGLLGYRSVLNGSTPVAIPNLRDKHERDKWRNDTSCTDPKVAGEMLLPTSLIGTPDIPDSVYESVKQKWEIKKEELKNK